MGDNDDATDFAYLLVFGFVAFGAYRIWDQRLRPWLTDQWTQITDTTGTSLTTEQLDGLTADVVAVGIIVLPVLILLLLLRRALRRRTAEAADRDQARA